MANDHSYYRYNGAVVCDGWLFTPQEPFNALDDDHATSLLIASAKAGAEKQRLNLDFTRYSVAVERIEQGEFFDGQDHICTKKSADQPR